MTNEEAIKRIAEHMAIHKMNEPRAINISTALQMAIYSLEKQIPKKPTPIDWKQYEGKIINAEYLRGGYWCPNCKHMIKSGDYCDDCGQKIDWGDENDKQN